MYDYLIVGAGLAGAVMAETLASQLNKKVLVLEKRHHIGGNAYDEYANNGLLIHKYGPHIFHTNNKDVFDYLSKFTEWRFYEHRVMAHIEGHNYPFPINRLTLNALYKINLKSNADTRAFFNNVRYNRNPILNSEDVIVNKIGRELFEKFFRYYTKKQWGLEPNELSPEVCSRIPVRSNNDCRYFTEKFQYVPKYGYTKMFEKMLCHKNIEVVLNLDYKNVLNDVKFSKLIYTGPIDYYFDYEYGELPYRSIHFEYHTMDVDHYQECAQINYMDGYAFTRVIEHKYLSGQINPCTIISKEFPMDQGEEYYPIPNPSNHLIYKRYHQKSKSLKNTLFCGRLAQYQYLNMDQTIVKALYIIKKIYLEYEY